jgi:hypothetical protein
VRECNTLSQKEGSCAKESERKSDEHGSERKSLRQSKREKRLSEGKPVSLSWREKAYGKSQHGPKGKATLAVEPCAQQQSLSFSRDVVYFGKYGGLFLSSRLRLPVR